MATTSTLTAQNPSGVLVDLGIAHIGASNTHTVKLPAGAYLKEVKAQVVTAFNSGTTATLTVSDGTTTFVSAENLLVADEVAVDDVANLGAGRKFYASGGTLTITLAETGTAATAGRALVYVEYVVLNRAHEVMA
jgi:hypothetical protein